MRPNLLKLAGLWLVLACSLRGAGLDKALTMDQADYRSLRGLQWLTPGTELLPAAGAPKAEMVLALAELAQKAEPESRETALWKEGDYETLYNLLIKYRGDIDALGVRQEALIKKMAATAALLPPLQERMMFLPAAGFRLHGFFRTTWDDVMVTGPGYGPGYNNYAAETGIPAPGQGDPARYRHGFSRLGLVFSGTYGLFSGGLEYDLETFLGDFDVYPGLRWLSGELRTPIAVEFGNISVKKTPLTFWRNRDEQPFEPEPFAGRRKRLCEECLSEGNDWNLRGIRLSTDVVFLEAQRLKLDVFGTILANAGSTLATNGKGSQFSVVYDTYLATWQAELPMHFMPLGPSMVPGAEGGRNGLDLSLGYIGTKVWDLAEGGASGSLYIDGPLTGETVRGFDSQVHSFQVGLGLFGGTLKFNAEQATSTYSNPYVFAADPKVGLSGYLTGTASTFSAELNAGWFGFNATYIDNGTDFVSSPAQGRDMIQDFSPYGPFPTEDIQYNPRTGGYTQLASYGGSTLLFSPFPQSRCLDILMPPQFAQAPALFTNFLQAYDHSLNNSLPYGLATPNRQGYKVGMDFNFAHGGLRPSLFGSVLQQIKSVPEGAELQFNLGAPPPAPPSVYTLMGGGLRVDMKPLFGLPARLVGGYRMEDTNNGGDLQSNLVAFTSTLLDSGIDFDPWAKTTLSYGYRHLDSNGIYLALFPAGSVPTAGQFYSHVVADIMGGGMEYRFTERVNITINYTSEWVTDVFAPSSSLEVDEGYLRFSVKY